MSSWWVIDNFASRWLLIIWVASSEKKNLHSASHPELYLLYVMTERFGHRFVLLPLSNYPRPICSWLKDQETINRERELLTSSSFDTMCHNPVLTPANGRDRLCTGSWKIARPSVSQPQEHRINHEESPMHAWEGVIARPITEASPRMAFGAKTGIGLR